MTAKQEPMTTEEMVHGLELASGALDYLRERWNRHLSQADETDYGMTRLNVLEATLKSHQIDPLTPEEAWEFVQEELKAEGLKLLNEPLVQSAPSMIFGT